MPKKLKVFHGLVNYGTQAGFFAEELRKNGIDALSVSQYDPYKRKIDVELLYGGNIAEKIVKHSWNLVRRFYWFFRYNTFHFYYGSSLFPKQLDLPLYELFGKKVVHHYLGKDVMTYKESVTKYKISNMAYSSGPEKEALAKDERLKKRLAYESKFSSLQLVCSPIYLEFVPGSTLLPLAIDLSKYKYVPKKVVPDQIEIMHAPTSRANKGTQFIIEAIDRLKKHDKFNIKFTLCENISHSELMKRYESCDIFVDQVLVGYGTAAIEAMAIGRPTISYIRKIHFNEEHFPTGIPIISANRDTIYEVLKRILQKKEDLIEIGEESRKFVENYHDLEMLTNKLIEFYKDIHSK